MTTTNRTHKLSRRGISPVIATVILVAVTLVAGVSIGGFVFGLFGTQTSTAQVTGASSTFPSGALGGTGTAITCETALGYGSFSLRNVGTANAVVTEMTLTYGGQSYTMTNATTTFATGCGLITAGSASTLYLGGRPAVANSGQLYIGEAILNTGARVQFTGQFR